METISDKPIGLTEWVYMRIKAAILNLDYAPGMQLQVEGLSRELEVSRTPVREALLRLQRDGLVEVISRVGFFVSEFSAKDLEELYELREILESRAVFDTVRSMTDGELKQIIEIYDDTRESVERSDAARFLETEITFHNLLSQSSRNKRLIEMIESLRDLTYRWRILSLNSIEDMRASLKEHKTITDAIQNRNAELASLSMGKHIQNAKHRIVKMIPRKDS